MEQVVGPEAEPGRDAAAPSSTPALSPLPRDLAPPEEPEARPALPTGRLVGQYEIEAEIGAGAMGRIYRAHDRRLGRTVALKVLLAGEFAGAQELARFFREARAIGRLSHPQIVPIHEIGEADGLHYFVMDYVEGESLAARIRRGPLPPAEALALAEQLAEALAYAHAHGVIHRDVKPSNVMLDREGRARLTDFGLAALRDEALVGSRGQGMTRSGATLGTPAYMSPEQARGENARVDERTDVYSLGVVLYEMLTGAVPFRDGSVLKILLQVMNDEPERPRRVNPRLGRDLETIVLKAMAKDPARRYASVAEMLGDLRRLRAGEAIRARPASLTYRLSRQAHRNRSAILSALGGTVLAAGVAALLFFFLRGAPLLIAPVQPPLPGMVVESEVLRTADPFGQGAGAEWTRSLGWRVESLEVADGELREAPGGEIIFARKGQPFYGDVRVVLTVELDPDAPPAAAAIELMLVADNNLPAEYAFRYAGDQLTLIGQEDPERAANPGKPPTGPGRRRPPKSRRSASGITVLAEERVPPLVPGQAYRVYLLREGVRLELVVTGPGLDARLPYYNVHLTDWRLKNFFLALRRRSSEVVCRDCIVYQRMSDSHDPLGPTDDRFYRGDKNGAADSYRTLLREECLAPLEAAATHISLGMIEELDRAPAFDRAADEYEQALALLAPAGTPAPTTPPPTATTAAATPLAPTAPAEPLRERVRRQAEVLRATALVRRLLVLAADETAPAGAFTAARDEVARSGVLEQSAAGWAWELPALAEELAQRKRQLEVAPALLSLAPRRAGWERLDLAAAEVGQALAEARRVPELVALHDAQPTARLAPAFREALERCLAAGEVDPALSLLAQLGRRFAEPAEQAENVRSARKVADKLIEQRQWRRLPEVYRALPRDELAQPFEEAIAKTLRQGELDAALDLLAEAHRDFPARADVLLTFAATLGDRLIESGRAGELPRLYAACPDRSLLDLFRRAALALARQDQLDAVCRVLDAAREPFGPNDPQLAEAAVLAARGLLAEGRHAELGRLCRAYPCPQLAGSCAATIAELGRAGRIEPGLDLFILARTRLEPSDESLTAAAAGLLRGIADARTRAAARRRLYVVSPALAADAAAERRWRLELADLDLALGERDAAATEYAELAREHEASAELAAAVRLRLGVLAEAAGRREEARRLWEELAESSPEAAAADPAPAQVARLLLGRITPEAFTAAVTAEAPEGVFALYLALAARAGGDAAAERRHLADARQVRDGQGPARLWPAGLLALLERRP